MRLRRIADVEGQRLRQPVHPHSFDKRRAAGRRPAVQSFCVGAEHGRASFDRRFPLASGFSPIQISDILTLCFVFIYILALFCRKMIRAVCRLLFLFIQTTVLNTCLNLGSAPPACGAKPRFFRCIGSGLTSICSFSHAKTSSFRVRFRSLESVTCFFSTYS